MSPRELESPPGLMTLYPRALGGALGPLLRRLPGVGEGEFPEESLALRGVEVDRDHLADYCRVCGFRLRDELPATYLHLVAFPLSMRLMTEPGFPFPVVGLVHVRNRIAVERAARADERFDVTVGLEGPVEHPRGTAFDVVAQAAAEDEVVWRSWSTYLRKEGGGSGGGRGEEDREAPAAGALWDVPRDAGRRYAAVSGDRNPIHLHPLTARLFGLPRPIAHGMWLKARCLAALEGRLPSAFAVDVRFKLPVQLPARVAFASRDAREFELRGARDGRPHLEGAVEPAAAG